MKNKYKWSWSTHESC